MKKLIFLSGSLFLLISCKEEKAKLTIHNSVSNVELSSISCGKFTINGNLMPGEENGDEYRDDKEQFPIVGQVEFYMTSQGNKVYLKTQETFTIQAGEDRTITITDNTPVYSSK